MAGLRETVLISYHPQFIVGVAVLSDATMADHSGPLPSAGIATPGGNLAQNPKIKQPADFRLTNAIP